MRESIQIGIQGAGFIADFHARALKSIPGIHLAAVCDPIPERAERFARKWDIPRTCNSVEAMLDDRNLQALHVLIPPTLHASAVDSCLGRELAVLVEKPLAVSAGDCRRLSQKLAENGRGQTVGVNQNFLFHPAFKQIVGWIRECRLGGIQHVTAFSSVPLRQLSAGDHEHWMFQEPGNIILEQAPHPLSQIIYLLGPVRNVSTLVSGEMQLSTGVPFHRIWQVAMTCERGTAQCYFHFGSEYRDSWIHVLGQDGAAVADLRRDSAHMSEKTRFLEPVDDFLEGGVKAMSEARQAIANFKQYAKSILLKKPGGDAFSRSFCNSIGAFYAALQGGPEYPAGFDHATAVMEACELIINSALGSKRDATGKQAGDYVLVP